MGEAARVNDPPSQAADSFPRAPSRVLVVEADYFALTARIDQNVIFWDANEVRTNGQIPAGVTHIWISDYTDEGIRERLLAQATRRNITAWHCALRELRRRLLPFWAEVANRSLIDPVDPDSDSVTQRADDDVPFGFTDTDTGAAFRGLERSFIDSMIDQPSDFEDVVEVEDDKESAERADREARTLRNRMRLLKKAAARVKSGAPTPPPRRAKESKSPVAAKPIEEVAPVPLVPEPTPPTPVAPAPPVWTTALDQLPTFDRQIFCAVYGINTGKPPQPLEVVAEEFALPEPNLKRVIARVIARLEPHGFAGP